MKKFLRSLKRQDGFTLVELMVVVAIIGILSAVAIPNFKKYQAKAKVSEAKLQLSALYMAMTSFYSDFNTYAQCLKYMGYDPSAEVTARYYAVGWAAATALNGVAYTGAINSGLNTTACPGTATATEGLNYPAGKGSGAAIAAVTELTAPVAFDADGTTFVAGAVGVIDGSKTATTTNSMLTVDQSKLIRVVPGREGF